MSLSSKLARYAHWGPPLTRTELSWICEAISTRTGKPSNMRVCVLTPRGHTSSHMSYRSWICCWDFLSLQSSRQGSVLYPLWSCACLSASTLSAPWDLLFLPQLAPLSSPGSFSLLVLSPQGTVWLADGKTGGSPASIFVWQSWNTTFLCKILWGLKQKFCGAIRIGFYKKLAISCNSVYNRKTCLHLASLSPQQLGSAVVIDSR